MAKTNYEVLGPLKLKKEKKSIQYLMHSLTR